MFINGKRHHSVAFINKFDKKQMIGKIDNKNQIDIQAVDLITILYSGENFI